MNALILAGVIEALVLTEGNGQEQPDAYNRHEDAAGCLQIRPCILADLRRWGCRGWQRKDRFDPRQSRDMARVWLGRQARAVERRIGRQITPDEAARMWCAGPDGWAQSNPKIVAYVRRFEEQYERMNNAKDRIGGRL